MAAATGGARNDTRGSDGAGHESGIAGARRESGTRSALIVARGLRHRYPDGKGGVVEALRDVSLDVTAGEWLAILGSNGSGKSTLARCLNGLVVPDEGTVHVSGWSTGDARGLLEVRRRVGLVFQNPDNQIVAPVVSDDVAFGPENLGVPSAQIRQRVRDALLTVGLDTYAEGSSAELSGGQKQRLAIAGALAMQPSAIVFDEATSMLDPKGRRSVLATVERLRRSRGLAVVWITHHMEEAARADRVVVLHEGALVAEGAPAEILSATDGLGAFGLAPPPAAQAAAMLRERGLALPAGIVTPEGLVDALCPFSSAI